MHIHDEGSRYETLPLAQLTALGWAFDPHYDRRPPAYSNFLSISGSAGANGGWDGFGSMQANGTDFPWMTDEDLAGVPLECRANVGPP